MWEFWRIHGYPGEGRTWLERALAIAGEGNTGGHAAVEFGLGQMYFALDDLEGARAHLNTSLELYERCGDLKGVAAALSVLAVVAINHYAYDEARTLAERALRIWRELRDRRGEAMALNYLAMAAREEGNLPRAIALYEEAMPIWRERHEARQSAHAVLALAITRRMAGDLQAAEALLIESQVFFKGVGDHQTLAVVALERGHLARHTNDLAAASKLYGTALRYFQEVDSKLGVIEAIEWLGTTAVDCGIAAQALELFVRRNQPAAR